MTGQQTMTRREQRHEATREEIKQHARAQMSREGTAAISLRSIARAMGVTAPALYRYYPSRDDLITDLVASAFHALADALEAERDAHAGEPAAARLRAILLTYRDWALSHPLDFALIYGNPIPGYVAPGEVTVPAAARGFAIIVTLIAEALANRVEGRGTIDRVPAPLEAHMEALAASGGYEVPLLALYLGVLGWTRLHGVIMLELFEHLQPVAGDVDALYRVVIDDLLIAAGIAP